MRTDQHMKTEREDVAVCSQCKRLKPVCCDTGYLDMPDGTVEHDEPRCADCCNHASDDGPDA